MEKHKIPGRTAEVYCNKGLGNELNIVDYDVGNTAVFVGASVPGRDALLKEVRALLAGYESTHPELCTPAESAPTKAKKKTAAKKKGKK